MWTYFKLALASIAACLILQLAALAQQPEIKRYNPTPWTKGRFTEVITVTGPGKTIYVAGVGAEEENTTPGSNPATRHPGNPYEQCRYAYDKIKRLLATHGATLADVVRQVVYVTDPRFGAPVRKCRDEAYGSAPIPVNTFLVVNALVSPTMLLEIEVTAVVAK